jgi:RNA polymerase sigma-70 factor (ECF subfamily)
VGVTAVTDFELLDRWGQGDRTAGAELFDRHFDALYRFFSNKVQEAPHDLMQQTVLACVEGRARFRREASFRTYLFQTARFQLYAYYRSREQDRKLDFETASVADLGTSPTGVIARKEDERLLLEGLRRIPLQYQVLLELYVWEDLTGAEVAEVLEMPESTVRGRLRIANDRLRAELLALAGDGCRLPDTVEDLQVWAKRIRETIDR